MNNEFEITPENKSKKKYDTKLLPEQIADEIIKMITDNNWESGFRLPNEYKLAEQLNVSRNTLREAIRALISRNILEIRRGDGTYIAENCGITKDPMGLKFIRNKRKMISDLLELRFMIEPELASLAALNATEVQAGQLYELCRTIEKHIMHREPYDDDDIKFHTMIAQFSNNILAPNLVQVLNQSPSPYQQGRREDIERDIMETHRDIVTAIQRHNPDEAHDAMYLHLLYARKYLKRDN